MIKNLIRINVFLGIFIFSVFLVASVFVLAKQGPVQVLTTNDQSGVSIFVPSHAVEVASNVFSLGEAVDVDGTVVEGYLFVHDKRENAKPEGTPGGGKGGGKDKSSTCYSLFAKGAKWKTTEPYITGEGVDLALTEKSLNTWDSEISFNVFGTGSSGVTDGADTVSPDGKNEVELQYLGATNTIAYTIVWGIFSGPPSQRELLEWDAVFNTAYSFGDADVNSLVMDYQNIATHEFGHALGLGHPDSTCTEETMYAYAGNGETKKRTLEAGDIAGINKLYN